MKKNGKNIKCEHCGNTFYVALYRVEKARFCSYECYWRATKIERKCGVCHTAFLVSLSKATEVTGIFCSKACAGRIEAHHILPWALYENLRYEI